MTTVLPARSALRTTWQPRPVAPAVWVVRALAGVPFALMAPEVIAAVRGDADANAHLSASVADVLGNAGFIAFALMLAVSPLATITGWRWHVVLRRDLGIAMCAIAWTDLVIAAAVTGDEFQGGVVNRVAGHGFLLLGTLSTVLTVPLVLTANRRAQRSLGTHWKSVQRTTYVIWVLVLLHLLVLFGLRGVFLHALTVSLALVVLRIPAVRSWWVRSRRTGSWRGVRIVAAVALGAVLIAGLVPFVQALATSGGQAFVQQPVDD